MFYQKNLDIIYLLFIIITLSVPFLAYNHLFNSNDCRKKLHLINIRLILNKIIIIRNHTIIKIDKKESFINLNKSKTN